jgi:signal transduction histidine kinase
MLVDDPQRQSPPALRPRSVWRRYGYAVLASCVATAARLTIGRYFGDQHRFPMLYMGILFASWYGGLGPAALAVALGALSAALFYVGPHGIVPGFAMANLDGLEFYFLVAVTVLILFEAERRARRRAIQAEEQLREAQKLESVGLLAGGIAHDFNNILTGVLGNASLALETLPEDSGARSLIQAIIGASERAAQLTRQLLAYAGKGNFVRAPVDFSQAARLAVDEVRGQVPARIELRLETAKGLPQVAADPEQIRRTVEGLLMNAVEAIGERSGCVTIRTAVQRLEAEAPAAVGRIEGGQYVTVTVDDTGCGMDEATLERIFDPFFTTKFMGRGLGLAAVAGIVRALDGAVTVWSEVGKGTRVQVCIPAPAV